MIKEIIIDGVEYIPKQHACPKKPITILPLCDRRVHLSKTVDCHIILHGATRCIIEVKGEDNLIQDKGEGTVVHSL